MPALRIDGDLPTTLAFVGTNREADVDNMRRVLVRELTPPAPNEHELLLTEIARCPLMQFNLTVEQPSHPCREVVTHQWPGVPVEDRRRRWKREHHLPEPWVGQIDRAPLLFVASNPSLSSFRGASPPPSFAPPLKRIGEHRRKEHSAFRHGLAAPKPNWTDGELVDRYSNAFDVWVSGGTAGVADETGRAGKIVSYWVAARALAEAFFEDAGDVRPGLDYALTEVVHCKSQDEAGVASAVSVCAPLYLRRVIALSPACLIVALGDRARNAIRSVFSYPAAGSVSDPMKIEGQRRRVVFLAHPGAKGKTRYPKTLNAEDLLIVQKWLAKAARPEE